MGELVFMRAGVIVIELVPAGMVEVGFHSEERIGGLDDDGGKGEMPLEQVEAGGEGIGEEVIVMDKLAIGAASAFGDTPAEGFERAGEDLGTALNLLEIFEQVEWAARVAESLNRKPATPAEARQIMGIRKA